jgi:hypothetical protein
VTHECYCGPFFFRSRARPEHALLSGLFVYDRPIRVGRRVPTGRGWGPLVRSSQPVQEGPPLFPIPRRAFVLPIAPVRYPSLPCWTGAQRVHFASDWYDGYATWAAGPKTCCTRMTGINSFQAASLQAGVCSTLRPLFVPTAARGWPQEVPAAPILMAYHLCSGAGACLSPSP